MLGPNVFIKRRVSKAGAIVALVMSGDAPDAGTPDEHGRCEAQHELKRKFLGAHGFNFFCCWFPGHSCRALFPFCRPGSQQSFSWKALMKSQ